MDIYASDEEKAEQIKAWWRENGISVIAGVLLAFLLGFGWRYWQGYQKTQQLQVAEQYQSFTQALSADKSSKATAIVDKLMKTSSSSIYTSFAALAMAAKNVETNQVDKAEPYLKWVIDKAELPAQSELAKLRLARIYFNDGKYDDALKLIEQEKTTDYASLREELKGDIYQAKGDKKSAFSAYQLAEKSLQPGDFRGQLLKMKLNDVATTNEN